MKGQGLREIHRNSMGPRAIAPRDIGPDDIAPSGIRPGDIDKPPQRLNSLKLVVRDLSEQLSQTYLPPEAHATVWQGAGQSPQCFSRREIDESGFYHCP
jgi:hypothetical protein